MRILALETSETAGSLAALEDDNLLFQLDLDAGLRSARSLAPGLETLWTRAHWRPSDVELVALTVGPGSFTGLRVGVTTAKMLAYAVGAQVLGVNTLDVIAEQAPPTVQRVAAVIDAQRGQVVTREYERMGQYFQPATPTALTDSDVWLAGLPAGCAVSGPILRKLREQVPNRLLLLDPACWTPQAATVGRLAYRHYSAGERGDIWQLLPVYSRRAAAEEKLDHAAGKTHGAGPTAAGSSTA